MDINASLYYQTALTLKVPTSRIEDIAGFDVKLGNRRYFFRGTETPFNCGSSLGIAGNKYCMNKILEAAGLPVPKAIAFSEDEFKKYHIDVLIENLSFPLVIKPTKGTGLGFDVLCNITNSVQLIKHMNTLYKRHQLLSIEEYHPDLNSYRVLVFYNKVIGVTQRFSARVVGDGIHTIRELIAISNIERKKLKATVSLGPMKVDEEYKIRLNELHLTLETIPKDKETIVLCYTCNSTRGGTMHSLGKTICKENARLCCQAARALDLNIVGFDVICEDILIPIEKSRGLIIEANHNPDISIHENPLSGIRNRVSMIILRRLIFKHPISFFIALYQDRSSAVYIKTSLLFFSLLAGKLFLT